MCTKAYDQLLFGSWDMVRDRCNCYFSFWGIFSPFTSLPAQKIKILKKQKKIPGDIIILHMHTKNYDQMIYGSWDMVCEIQLLFLILGYFLPFHPLTVQKIKFWKSENKKQKKKSLEIPSFYICVPKIMISWCMVSEIWCLTDGRMDRWMEKGKYRGGLPT